MDEIKKYLDNRIVENITCPFCNFPAKLVGDSRENLILIICDINSITYKMYAENEIMFKHIISNLKENYNLWFLDSFDKEDDFEIIFEKLNKFYEEVDKLKNNVIVNPNDILQYVKLSNN